MNNSSAQQLQQHQLELEERYRLACEEYKRKPSRLLQRVMQGVGMRLFQTEVINYIDHLREKRNEC